jgi:hypothetical protein
MTDTPTSSAQPAAGELLCSGAFLSNDQLSRIVETGAASRSGAVIVAVTGERFALQDAVRILGVEPGKTDPYGLTGRVASLTALLARGFVLAHRYARRAR